MKRIVVLVLMAAASCTSQPPPAADPNQPEARPTSGVTAMNYGEIDKYAGQFITLEGTFDHVRGTHGVVVLAEGLRVYLPHFDLFKRDDAWLDYVGKRVWVSGLLHTYTRDIPGYWGPSLELTDSSGFGVVSK